MKKFLMAAAAASLFALPALAQSVPGQLSSDAEIRVQEEWQQLVAKTNAGRVAPIGAAHAAVATPVTSDALSNGAEIRAEQEWTQLVAKTNADREAPAFGDVAAVQVGATAH
jgi:hypothetical protein